MTLKSDERERRGRGGARPGAGRPPLGDKARTRSVRVYVTEVEFDALARRAAEAGEPLAVVAYRILGRTLRREGARRGR